MVLETSRKLIYLSHTQPHITSAVCSGLIYALTRRRILCGSPTDS